VSYTKFKYVRKILTFEEDELTVQSLNSPVTTRWIPQSELEAIRHLPDTQRIARAYETSNECRCLSTFDTLDALNVKMQEHLLALTTSPYNDYIENGKALNTSKRQLFEKLATFDTTGACSASTRRDLTTLVKELADLAQTIHGAVYNMKQKEWAAHQADSDFRSYMMPF
jgi:hypothetical protein